MKKFENAFVGLKHLIADASVQIQLLLGCLAITIGWFKDFETWKWCILLLCIIIVIVCEMINTVIEKLCDIVEPKYNQKIKYVKDASAGFTLFASLCVCIVGIFLLL